MWQIPYPPKDIETKTEKMLTAEEAREMSNTITSDINAKLIKEIMIKISSACKKGYFYITYPSRVPNSIQKQLEDIGYGVYTRNTDDGYTTTISWN